MKTTILLALFAVFTSFGPMPEDEFAQHYFGIGLGTGPHSALFTCFLVKEYNDKIVDIKPLTSEQFIWQATAMNTSKANPDSVDFFEAFRVSSCLKIKDPETGLDRRPCDPFSKIWKLRFSKYPLHNSNPKDLGEGWAKHEMRPSEGQLAILANYGIKHATGMCYGDNAFRLLRDINDPIWVQRYRSAE